jgi:hypothetical protein
VGRVRLLAVEHCLDGRIGNVEPLGHLGGLHALIREGLDNALGLGFPFDGYGLEQNHALQKGARFVYLFVFINV